MSDTKVVGLTEMTLVTEEELLDRAREGDRSAFGALYLRHRDAAHRVASMCTSSRADAEDAMAEGFAKVFAALPRMGGREITFRPYLLTCVRNAATDRVRRERRIDLRDAIPDAPGDLQADDVALLGLERNLVGEALQTLPSRWRTVLWLTEVEGLSPAEVSSRIGIKPNAVAALAYRARKGLREAYLQAHLRAEASTECRATVGRLGNYVRGDLAEKDRLAVQVHLDECNKCRRRRDELTDVNATLRSAFLPVPLLLAGLQRRWFDLFSSGSNSLLAKAPEIVPLAQAVDTTLVNKALAGLTMVVLAISGAAVPQLLESPRDGARDRARLAEAVVSGADGKTGSASAARATSGARQATRPLTDAQPAPGPVDSGIGVEPAAGPEPGDDAGTLQGATRSTLLRLGRPADDQAEEDRHRILQPGAGGGAGGLLGATPLAPVADLLESTLGHLGLDPLVPVQIGVSDPSTTGLLKAAPLGLDVVVDPAGGIDVGKVPVSEAAPGGLAELDVLGAAVNVGTGPVGGLLQDAIEPVTRPVSDLLGVLAR